MFGSDLMLRACGPGLAVVAVWGTALPKPWDSLGYAHHQLGQHSEAKTCYRQALDAFRELGDGYGQAVALIHLGETHHTVGDLQPAREAWRLAVSMLEDIHHPDAEHVRAKLAGLDSKSASSRG